MKNLLYFGIILILFSCSSIEKTEDYTALNYELGISFPPVADTEQMNFTQPLLQELQVKKIRISENWSLREPTEGNFNWNPLDERIQWAETNGYEVYLTLQSNGPDWACSSVQNSNSCVFSNNQKFKNYTDQLLQRYANKITKIQFGNEWQTEFWYAGNAQQFIEANNILYQGVQQYSPNTKVVLGGFTTISLRFLAGCEGSISSFYDDEGTIYNQEFLDENCQQPAILEVKERINTVLNQALYDYVDIHLYDDVENWTIYFNTLKNKTEKPIIISEFGGPNHNVESHSENFQAERLAQYIQKINTFNIEEAYYFKLVEGTDNPAHVKSGLIRSSNLSKKQSFFKFKQWNNH